MRAILAYLTLLLVLSASGAARADPPAGYRFVAFDAGMAQARAENKPVLLYFGRYGCAWCDHTNRQTFSDPGLRELFNNHYALIYADAESGNRLRLASGERLTEAKLGARLGAYATPLFVFMTPQGEVIARVPGFKTVEDFRNYDRYVREGHYRERTLAEFLAGTRP